MRLVPSRFLVVLSLALLPLLAMAADPIYNVPSQAVSRGDGTALAPDDVKRAIISAGASRGWVITPAGPSALTAQISVRTHTAECFIEYSATQFSIKYVTSTNLDYGTNRKGEEIIHKNYNKWVNNLRSDVVVVLSAMAN